MKRKQPSLWFCRNREADLGGLRLTLQSIVWAGIRYIFERSQSNDVKLSVLARVAEGFCHIHHFIVFIPHNIP